MSELLLNDRRNQVTGAIDWLTFADAGLPIEPEIYEIVNLDADRAVDGGHFRNLYGIRLGKIPNPATLEIYEYVPDSDSDVFDSVSETGAEYTLATAWPPNPGEFITIGRGDIVYFDASKEGEKVVVLPTYTFRAVPTYVPTLKKIVESYIGTSVEDAVAAAVPDAITTETEPGGIIYNAIHSIFPPAFIHGLTLSNSSGDPTHDIDIGVGACSDDTDAIGIVLSAVKTKRLDAAWSVGNNQGGLDTGSFADGTYHGYLIKRSDTGVVDCIFSTSASSPVIPANYDYKRLVGSILVEGGVIVAFKQIGNWFQRTTPKQAVSANNPGTSAVLRDMFVPIGIKVKVKARWIFSFLGAGTAVHACVSSPDEADAAPSAAGTPGANASQFGGDAGRNSQHAVELETFTNTVGQVRTRVDYSDGNLDIYGVTVGWYHPRGQW